MDILSIIGVVLGLIAIIGGAILKGSSAGALVGSAAFVIVVVGTFAASLVQTPMATFLRAWKIVSWVFKPPVEQSGGHDREDRRVEQHRAQAGVARPRVRGGGARRTIS